MKLLIVIFFSFITLVSAEGYYAQEIAWLPKYGQKKIKKTFAKLWKDQVVTIDEIVLSEADQKVIGIHLRKQTLYKVLVNNELKAYLYLGKAPSKFDKFDFMVLFDLKLSIKLVKVLVYREDSGSEIMSSSFLKQFKGKDKFSKFELGKDVQGISGATISCRSTVNGVKKLTQKINILSENKKL